MQNNQEYFKQRERLKFITQNNVNKKVLDPDIMIEQLISDKDTFKFKSGTPYILPKWLKLENKLVPTVYEQVWQAVRVTPANQYCDTTIITQLFTTSGLSLEKLGYLWSLTNVSSPGFLTQQELYVMLALIALVQTGYPIKDISILKDINHPILPQLNYSFLSITVANPAINRSIANNTVTDSKLLNGTALPQTFQFTQPVAAKPPTDLNLAFASNRVSQPKDAPRLNLLNDFKNISINEPAQVTTKPLGFDFLTLPDTSSTSSSNLEPRSLDLPSFETNTANVCSVDDDDEFTEFQSASIVTTDEYTDFRSASPVKYSIDSLVNDTQYVVPDVVKNSEEPSLSANDDFVDQRSFVDADKYDVFRTLMEHPKESVTNAKEEEEDEEDSDEEDEEDDENFGEFYAANVKPDKSKSGLSIKEKCLDACLRLMQEGLLIFSNIQNEQTLSEVLSDERGYRYFNQLKIVYETSQRFQRKFPNQNINDAIQCVWEKLALYTKYVPIEELLDEMSPEDDIDASNCKLCETKCDLNCVRYAGNNYHVSCINLFLHFVEDSEISAMLNI